MQRLTIKLISALCAALIIFSAVVPAIAASKNRVNKVPQVADGHKFYEADAPFLIITEKSSDYGVSGSSIKFELRLENAKWLKKDDNNFYVTKTSPGAVNSVIESHSPGITVEDAMFYGDAMILKVQKNKDKESIINIPLITEIIGDGEVKVTVDPVDSALSGGTYVFAVVGVGKTIITIDKVEEFTHVGNLATIRIDETRIGALGNTTGQSIKLKLPPNFTWSKADAANFLCSGGLNDTVIKYEAGLNTRTLELSYDPTPSRSARGSIFLQGLQIQADQFAPCDDVIVDIEGTSVTAAKLIVAKRVIGSLARAHLVGTITGAKKFPAIGIWEYQFNSTKEILDLAISVIEETNDGSINRNFTTFSSRSGAGSIGEEGFRFTHVAEMRMLIDGSKHTAYAFAWGDVSVFEAAFLPDTEDSKKQFLNALELDYESMFNYIKAVIADSDDVVYGIPSIIYLQGQLVSPVVLPYLIQVSANSAMGGTVTGYGNYECGNNITVLATPNSSYKFDNWAENGTVVSTSTAYTFTVTGNRNLVANFSKTSSPPPSGGGGGGGGGGGSVGTPPVQKQEKTPEPETTAIIGAESVAKEIITRDDGKAVESFTIREEAKEQIEKAKKEGKTAVEIKIEKSEASVVAVSIPKDVLESVEEMNLVINTPNAALELPKELVQAIVAAGRGLSIQVESGEAATVSQQMAGVTEAAGAEILGTPTVINTGVRGNTNVSIPLSGIEMPKSATERQAFLDTLRIFAVHGDGERKVIEGTITYDTAGNPLSINFTVDKFSTFAIIKVPRAAVIGEPLEVRLVIGQLKAIVNGKGHILDAEPFIKSGINSRTMVPIRFIGEALGVEVKWVDEDRQVTIRDPHNFIILTIDSDKVLVNNSEKTLDCPAEILPPGRTFVPFRFVSENLGAQVFYDTNKREITIRKNMTH